MSGGANLSAYGTFAVTLECHLETPSSAVCRIDAHVGRMPRGLLAVTYILEGDLARVRVPAMQPARTADRLWEHTCFEIFIARKGLAAYHEFNFAPSGEWAVHAFERYREGGPMAGYTADPQIKVRSAGEKLELDAVVRLDLLSPLHGQDELLVGLSAVVEDRGGALSYWALAHPDGKPDFHHARAFALQLANA